jgi:hypothetical protein
MFNFFAAQSLPAPIQDVVNAITFHQEIREYAENYPRSVSLAESERLATATRQVATSAEWKLLKRQQRILEQAAARSVVTWESNS